MLRDKYTLIQDKCCGSPANFFIYQNLDADNNTALS